jgi:hypothetical protein
MPHFGNNTFLESNEQEQHITQINIQEPILYFANNAAIFKKNFVGPLIINVGPSFPFHPLHFLFFCSSLIPLGYLLECKKLLDWLKALIFGKIIWDVNKEEVERLA